MAWQDRYSIEAFRAAIKKLIFEDGMTCAQAARMLGPDVTRNMVVRQRQTLMGRVRTTVTFPDSVWPSTTKTDEAKPETEAREVPVHLLKVLAGQCRAPLWPDFLRSTEKVAPADHMLCGHPVKEGSAYCADHHEVFYPPDLQKRVTRPKKQEVVDNTRHFR